MNKGHIFDDITRITARAGVDISRRKALSWIVGTVAYGALGGIGLGRKALADTFGACVLGSSCNEMWSVTCVKVGATFTPNWRCCSQTSTVLYVPKYTPGICITNKSCISVQDTGMCSPCYGATNISYGTCCSDGIHGYTPSGSKVTGRCILPSGSCYGGTNLDPAECTQCGGDWLAGGSCCLSNMSGSFSGGVITFNSACGFSHVSVTSYNNCTSSISPFNCETSSVTVTATKIDTTKSASIYAVAVDCTGNNSGVDPVMTTLSLTTGRWVRQTFTDIPKAESYISVTNNNPGLKTLDIRVNSHYHKTLELRANETKNINVAEAMITGNHNTVSLMGQGKLGASADVSISDTPPPIQPTVTISRDKNLSLKENTVWGHIAEELHETSDLHSADVSTQTVLITFKGDLNSFTAGNIGLYSVEVNGKPVVVQKADAQSQADGVELLLQLPPNTFKSGNTVDVYWEDLQDKEGQPLAGHVSLIAQRLH